MANKKHHSASKGSNKTFAAKRRINQPLAGGSHQASKGSRKAFQEHDAANRLGDYEGTGNHARTGNRGHQ